MSSNAVVLHEAGHFSADGPLGSYDLILATAGDNWLLLAPSPDGDQEQPVIARNAGLEFSLRLLAATAGLDARFTVDLPSGASFGRPGRVPVEEVLAAFGYASVTTVTAYVLVVSKPGTPVGDVRASLEARIAGRPATVIDVETMDEGGGEESWCCSLSLSYPGVFGRGSADGIVVEVLSGCGLELIGRGELDLGPNPRRANAADVIRFASLTVAA